jgi:hypothetical protein
MMVTTPKNVQDAVLLGRTIRGVLSVVLMGACMLQERKTAIFVTTPMNALGDDMSLYPYTCEFCGVQKLSAELPLDWLIISVDGEDGYVCEDCLEKRKNKKGEVNGKHAFGYQI